MTCLCNWELTVTSRRVIDMLMLYIMYNNVRSDQRWSRGQRPERLPFEEGATDFERVYPKFVGFSSSILFCACLYVHLIDVWTYFCCCNGREYVLFWSFMCYCRIPSVLLKSRRVYRIFCCECQYLSVLSTMSSTASAQYMPRIYLQDPRFRHVGVHGLEL